MAARFGAREEIEQASLSPDGNWVAFVQPLTGQGAGLYVADLRGSGELQTKRILAVDGKPDRLAGCQWASDTRLLCTVYGMSTLGGTELVRVSRIVAVNADGGNVKLLNTPGGDSLRSRGVSLSGGAVIGLAPGNEGHVLMMRNYIPETTIGTRNAQTKEGLGVDDVDSLTLRARPVEPPKVNAREYIADGLGNVRVMGTRTIDATGYDKDERRYYYRPVDGGGWKPLSIVMKGDEGFDPSLVDAGQNLAYGFKRKDGRLAAYSRALDEGAVETLLFAHDQVDVDGFITIGRNKRPIGVSYVTDRRGASYFDPAIAKLAKSLSSALSGQPNVRVVDSSRDEKKLLIWAGSDVDPGSYFLLDRATSQMAPVASSRPPLDGVALAPMQHITYAAADGTQIPAYLTLPPKGTGKGLPAIVMPHGGPGARDEWGFAWMVQYFASQGYAVLQPNFRGSTGYGESWFQQNGFKSWRTAIGDVDDGGRWLVKQGIASANKLAIIGWSYGGYAALQSAVTEPDLFKAVIAIAPVTDLDRVREERRGWSDFRQTSDFIGTGPHIAEASPARHADAINAPVLLFHGTQDLNVGVQQSRLMQDRLAQAGKSSELVVFDGLDHYLEDSQARIEMLTKSAALLERALKR
ncbi:Dipeptidyl aminopeptidase/acylaminoacyl peptidase [Sphingobium sp. AP50]|nr:Dipeptidyl aminopeptidase/acylaminoacyl peptidase [Sphingobium sp. AP50]SEJ67810.1 Dipeptidyl aminopeptidase/acylaminoacyl peptidase [Sphingobium sp. AP50]